MRHKEYTKGVWWGYGCSGRRGRKALEKRVRRASKRAERTLQDKDMKNE